jgi:hypothetical protein
MTSEDAATEILAATEQKTPQELLVIRDANLAANYYKLLIAQNIERADALEITRAYVMSKVSQELQREESQRREERELNDKEKAQRGMQRGPGNRAHFTGQHTVSKSDE